MKTLSEQLHSFDQENFRRIASGLPEVQSEAIHAHQTAEIFNSLFSQLRAAFPASISNFSDQAQFNELRRQWLLAFMENGITTMEQVNAGMRVARRQNRPFLPAPGQFIAWCKEGSRAFGITADDVMTEFWRWRKLVFRYPISEQYPWPQPVLYHICLELRRRSTDGQLSEKEMQRVAAELLGNWEKRAGAGIPVPPIRRAIAAPKRDLGPTPAQILLAKYESSKGKGDSGDTQQV
jgi:hypothetical protein